MSRVIVSGGSVVLPDRVVDEGSVVVEADRITAVEPGSVGGAGERAIDASGRLVLPGLIDLHNDGLEGEINPRPSVNLPLGLALMTLDRRLAASGVTTEFHAVFFANMVRKQRKLDEAPGRVAAIGEYDESGRSLVSHRVLFRVDLWNPDSLAAAEEASRDVAAPLISLNDHTPGQGQYRDPEVFKKYFRDALGRSREDAERDAREQTEFARDHPEVASRVLERVRELVATRDVILMSHDDDSAERAEQMYAVGARVAEFPVTFGAAERQRELGMLITAGAPNIVRGGSASGNISAEALLERGLVDVLCADYHAPSLLFAAWKLVLNGRLSLPDAVRLITLNPARAVRLGESLGSLEPGKRADLIVVDPTGTTPTVELTMRAGSVRYVASTRAPAGDLLVAPTLAATSG